MHQQHICPQMAHKCHTCQLLHVQILDTYAINKVTEAMLSIHSTFLAYATEQHMLVTLHIYVPFYVYSSLQIGPTLLNTSSEINELQHLSAILLQNMCRHTNRHTDGTTGIRVAADTLYIFFQILILKPYPIKSFAHSQ